MSEEHPDERSFRRHHYAKTKLLFRGQNYIPPLPPSLIQRSSLVLQAIFDAQQKMASVPLLMCLAFCRFCYSRPRSLCFHSKSLTQVLS